MKVLLVFASALVLVAHGNVVSSEVEDGPQGVFAEEAPSVRVFGVEDEPRVSSSEQLKGAYAVEDPAAERVPALESGVYIPIDSRVCTFPACTYVCNRLGFKYGMCVSLDTCWCYK